MSAATRTASARSGHLPGGGERAGVMSSELDPTTQLAAGFAARFMIRLGDRWLANPLGWRAPMDGDQRPTPPRLGQVRASRLITGAHR